MAHIEKLGSMMHRDKTKWIAATLIVAAVFLYRAFFVSDRCAKDIITYFESSQSEANRAVFLINTLNTGCRTCLSLYHKMRDEGKNITFFVLNDFSENDITNLRLALQTGQEDIVMRMPSELEALYESCNKVSHSNILFNTQSLGNVPEIIRF